MKLNNILIAFFVFWGCYAIGQNLKITDVPINDFAGILKDADKKSLNEFLYGFEKENRIEFKIVIIDSISNYSGEEIIDDFVKKVFNSENMPYKNKKRAILLLVALNDRKLNIEYGNEVSSTMISLLSDIVDEKIIPFFKNGEYARGIYDGIREFIKKTEKKQANQNNISKQYYYFIAGILFFIFIFYLFFKKKKKRVIIEEFGKGAFGSW